MTVLAATCVFIGVTFTGVVAAAPALAAGVWHYPNPSIGVNSAGDQWVFWKGTNGGLWEAYNYGSGWVGPSHITQAGTIGSPPTVQVVPTSTTQYIAWDGTNGYLYLLYWNGSWNGPYNLHIVDNGATPSMMMDNQGVLTIGWKGADGYLDYAYSTENPTGSGWSGPFEISNSGVLGSTPSLYGPAGGQYLDAAWVGSGSYNDLWWRMGNGSVTNLGQGPLQSPPSISEFPDPNDEAYQGFWTGSDNYIWDAAWDYDPLGGISMLHDAADLYMGPAESAPSGVFGLGSWYVVWQGTDNNLYEATCDPANGPSCWNWGEIPGMGPL